MSTYPEHLYPGCPCHHCDSPHWPTLTFTNGNTLALPRMTLCPTCGSKRCPGANHHDRHPET